MALQADRGASVRLPGFARAVRRVNVIGSSGAGKTTYARKLAAQLHVPFVELDTIHNLADWREMPLEPFRARVREIVASDAWVIDGNYSKVRDLVWSRADTVVFIDPPRWRVMVRLILRTLRRMITREPLWNGNRERWSNLFSLDPKRSILAWSWTQFALTRERFEAARRDPAFRHIEFLRRER